MKSLRILLILLMSAWFIGCQNSNATADNEILTTESIAAEPVELIINLTSDANQLPESSLMALHFASKALENDLNVTVFMNVKGVLLASKTSSSLNVNNENLHGLINQVMEQGGKVVACPMCMKVQGVDEGDLLPGIDVSSPGFMMDKLKENPTVFTY